MLGGDLRVRDLHMVKLSLPGDQSLFPGKQTEQSRISLFTAVILLIKATICTDSFLISAQFHSGILSSAVVCVVVFVLSQASFHVFVRTWSFGHAYTYHNIWAQTLNDSTGWIPDLIVIFSYMTICALGAWEIQRYTSDIIAVLWPSAPDLLFSPWFLEYLLSVFVVVPCFLAATISQLRSLSIVGCAALLVAMVCLFVHFFRERWDIREELPVVTGSFDKWLDSFQSFNSAFFAHPFVAAIVRDMDRPTRTRTVGVTYLSNVICAIVTFMVALIGAMSGTDCPANDMIFIFLNPQAPEVTIGKFAVLIVSLMSSAFFTWHLARIIANLVVKGGEFSTFTVVMSGTGVMCAYTAINMLGELPRYIIFALGNIGFSVLAFVLPPLFYLVQFKTASIPWMLVSIGVFAAGIVLCALSIIALVRRLN
jgi:hypothetical protein